MWYKGAFRVTTALKMPLTHGCFTQTGIPAITCTANHTLGVCCIGYCWEDTIQEGCTSLSLTFEGVSDWNTPQKHDEPHSEPGSFLVCEWLSLLRITFSYPIQILSPVTSYHTCVFFFFFLAFHNFSSPLLLLSQLRVTGIKFRIKWYLEKTVKLMR